MPRISDERRAARRDAYLRAAWRCFARSGIHDVTMEQISADAGTSSGTIYLYFQSKEELIRAAIAASLGRFAEIAEVGDTLPGARMSDILAAVERVSRTEDGVDLLSLALQGWGFAQTDAATAAVIATALGGILTSWTSSARAVGLSPIRAREHAEAVGAVALGYVVQRALLGTPTPAALARGVAGLTAP